MKTRNLLFYILLAFIILASTFSIYQPTDADTRENRLASYHLLKTLNYRQLDIEAESVERFVRAKEEQLRLEQKRLEQARLEQEKKKLEQERLEQERIEEEKLEKQRQEEEQRKTEEKKKKETQQQNHQPSQPEKQKQEKTTTDDTNQTKDKQQNTNPYPGISSFERDVVKYTNEERVKHGLPELKIDHKLSEVAWYKSRDMQTNKYFSHTSPTYGSPFDMMMHYEISYTAAAENIAMGYGNPKSLVDGWMNSEGHRRNILNENYTHIGVGFMETGAYATQLFKR